MKEQEQYGQENSIISPEDIMAATENGPGADIAKLFLEDEFIKDLLSGETEIYYNAIKKLGIGQYDKQTAAKILRRVEEMKTMFAMSSMEYEYTWEVEREFTIFRTIALKNISMGLEGTFLKRAFGSIQETSFVQTLNNPVQQKRPGLISSIFKNNR